MRLSTRAGCIARTLQTSSASWFLTLGFVAACGGDKPREEALLPEPPYHGARTDLEAASWGNGAFEEARFSPDGKFLVTFNIRNLQNPSAPAWKGGNGKSRWTVQVWDAANGDLISTFGAAGVGLIDGTRRRVISQPLEPNAGGVGVFSVDNGKLLTRFPTRLGRPFTLTDDGSALVFIRPDSIHVWSIEPQARIRSGNSPLPLGQPQPVWAASPDGRWLALGFMPRLPPASRHRYFLIDLRTVKSFELAVPDGTEERTTSSFAFSPDGERLAIGTGQGIWTYETTSGRWGRFIAGDSRRKLFLTPIGFSAGGTRLVAHGYQRAFVLDVNSGRTLGSTQIGPNAWPSVSADGSRILLYDRPKDLLRVLDGRDANPIGWVCAYACNAPLKPGWIRYAITPDGRNLAASHPNGGSGVWSVDEGRLVFPLNDPAFPPIAVAAPVPGPHESVATTPSTVGAAVNPAPVSPESPGSSIGEKLKDVVSTFTAPPDTVDSFPDAAVNRRFRVRREGIAKMEQALRALVAAESVYKEEHGSWTRELPAKYLDWGPLERAGLQVHLIVVTNMPVEETPSGWWATVGYDNVNFKCTVFVGEADLVFPGAREREPFCRPYNVDGVINQPPPYQRVRPFRVNPPPNPIHWNFRDRCRGGKCQFDSLRACTDITTRSEPRSDSPPSFTWKKGEAVKGYETDVQLVSPGMVIFRGAITVPVLGKDEQVRFTPADTVYLLSTAGDGTYDWFYRRTQRRTPPFWSANGPARLIKSEQTSWSLSIIRADSQVAWFTPSHGTFVGWDVHPDTRPGRCEP